MVDIHCHILPGVDDGAHNLEESVRMLHAARRANIDRIVCTPHCRGRHYNENKIRSAYATLLPHAGELGIELDLGFEVYWEKLMELGIENASELCLGTSNLLLLEFSPNALPALWERMIEEIQKQGIDVVIAHPERYTPVQRDIDIAGRMKELNCYLQLSGNFTSGGFTSKSKRCAIELLRAGYADYVASDAHRAEDYASYKAAMKIASKY